MRQRLRLRSLNKINERLDTTQGRVSTGLKVASSSTMHRPLQWLRPFEQRFVPELFVKGLITPRQLEKWRLQGQQRFPFDD